MRLRLFDLAEPTAEPVTAEQVKLAGRIDPDNTAFDLVLPGNIKAARAVAEHRTGLVLASRVKRAEFDNWPDRCDFLPIVAAGSSAIALSAVTCLSGGAWVAAPAGAFVAVVSNAGVQLVAASTAMLPQLDDVPGARVRVDVNTTAVCPASAALYITAQAAHWTENPSATTGDRRDPTPFLEHLLDAVCVYG